MSSSERLSFALQDRDVRMLKLIGECGGMTALQLSRVFFYPPEKEPVSVAQSNCERRVKLLSTHGYLAVIEQPQIPSKGRKPFVYTLTRKGATTVAHYHGCALEDLVWHELRTSAGEFLDHLLLTNDVRVAIQVMCATERHKDNMSLVRWDSDLTLKRTHSQDRLHLVRADGRTETRILVPDAYLHLSVTRARDHRRPDDPPTAREYHCFVEVDRGTETGESSVDHRRTWAKKVELHQAYYEQFYQARYATQGLRVLVVTTSTRRLETLKRVTEQAGGSYRFWLTTFDQVCARQVLTEPIWSIAGSEKRYPLLLL